MHIEMFFLLHPLPTNLVLVLDGIQESYSPCQGPWAFSSIIITLTTSKELLHQIISSLALIMFLLYMSL